MYKTPRESAKIIADSASHVKVQEEGIKKLGEELIKEVKSGKISVNNFSQNKLHPKADDPEALNWLLVADTLNFCFWTKEGQPKWTVDKETGYFALCAAINRARKENIDILNPKFFSKITEKQLSNILRSDSDVPVPLLSERVNCLHEVGECLLEKFDGSFENVIKAANKKAVKLLELIVENFKCFNDVAIYKGHKVSFQKRAQILIGDIWSCFKNEGIGHFEDIDEITMFADYRIPQPLVYFGVLKYSEELLNLLKKDEILENGNEMEVEIRGCSIYAVDRVTKYVNEKVDEKHKINDILIDHYLWDYRRQHNDEIVKKDIPFHKTLSIYY